MARVSNKMVKKNLPILRKIFPLYSKFNIKIIDKFGDLVRLVLNRPQRVVWKKIKYCLDNNLPIRIYVIKARQLGFTTLFTAILFWLATLFKNGRFLAIAQDEETSRDLAARFQAYYLHSHPVLQPQFRTFNRQQIHFAIPVKKMVKDDEDTQLDIGLDSYLMVRTADAKTLGRAKTIRGALLTEFCLWPILGIDVKQRLIALFQAIPKKPGTFIFIESTAQGENYGKVFWDQDNGFDKLFISWLSDDEYRTEVTSVDEIELSMDEESTFGDEYTERNNILKELRIWYPEEEYGEGCDFPGYRGMSYEVWLDEECLCRLKWRREKILEECQGDKFAFKQEYPTTVYDAFSFNRKSVFNNLRLMEMHERVKDLRSVRYVYRHDDKNHDINRKFKVNEDGHLRIFELPEHGSQYVLFADGARGVTGGDPSAIVVLKLPRLVEVASYANIIPPSEFAGVCNYLGRLYNNGLLAVERNDKGGYAALQFLVNNYKYPYLYFDKEYQSPGQPIEYGFYMNEAVRSLLIGDMQDLVEDREIFVNSIEILDEMKSFVEHPKTKKVAAAPGCHDDLIISLMGAAYIAKQVHIHKPKEKKRRPENEFGTYAYFMKIAMKQQHRKERRRILY